MLLVLKFKDFIHKVHGYILKINLKHNYILTIIHFCDKIYMPYF